MPFAALAIAGMGAATVAPAVAAPAVTMKDNDRTKDRTSRSKPNRPGFPANLPQFGTTLRPDAAIRE